MNLEVILKITVGVLPVLAFLGVLLYMESYKLVRLNFVIRVLLGGALTSVLAYFANGFVIEALDMKFMDYTHFVAPVIEESLKGLVVVYLFRSNRIGFLVDAAMLASQWARVSRWLRTCISSTSPPKPISLSGS